MSTSKDMTLEKAKRWVDGGSCKYSEKNVDAAWQYLIDTGLAWELGGWYSELANKLIETGIIETKG